MNPLETREGEAFPLPKDKFILIDLDKTLIATDYQPTADGVNTEVERLESLGWTLGLSSDTPLTILRTWADRFGVKGPIIAERGALVYLPNGTEIPLDESEEYFSTLKKQLAEHLLRERVPFYHGAAGQLLGNPRLNPGLDEDIVLLNAYRRFSLSFYAKSLNTDGLLLNNEEMLTDLVGVIRSMIGVPPFEINEDINPEYGICILSSKAANKRRATIRLMKELNLTEIGMIGDSRTDILGRDIAKHYAVGNTTEDFREIADYVSPKTYTSGVIDILRQIT